MCLPWICHRAETAVSGQENAEKLCSGTGRVAGIGFRSGKPLGLSQKPDGTSTFNCVNRNDSPEATMDLIIRDAWFGSHTVVDVGPGDDRLIFERCTFMGGTVRRRSRGPQADLRSLPIPGHPLYRAISVAPHLDRLPLACRQTSRALCQRLGSPDSSRAAESHAVRRVSAYSIVVNRHPVAPGRVVVHPLCSVQHDGRLVQCLSTAKTPRDTGDPVASDLLGVKLCEQLRDKHRESWSNLGMVHSPGSTFFASLPSPAASSFISLFAPTQRFCSSTSKEHYARPKLQD